MTPSATLAALRERGCTCGLDDEHGDPVGGCPVHVKPGDNRGLRAWFRAGMPESFPMTRVNCSRCYRGAQRCRDEAEKIVAACEAEERDLTDDERAQLDLYAEGARVLSQADALMYPSPEQDAWADEHDGEPTKHFPSTICPRCSTPAAERRLVAMVEAQGLPRLNDRRVFAWTTERRDAAQNGVEETSGADRESGLRTPGVSSTPHAAQRRSPCPFGKPCPSGRLCACSIIKTAPVSEGRRRAEDGGEIVSAFPLILDNLVREGAEPVGSLCVGSQFLADFQSAGEPGVARPVGVEQDRDERVRIVAEIGIAERVALVADLGNGGHLTPPTRER